jgi:putative oxidoreductase
MSESSSPGYSRGAVDVSLLVMRIIVGAIFFAHGAQKLFGPFDGMGLAGTVEMMGPMGYPVSVGECLGGIGIMFAFPSRFSAASNIVIMLGVIAMVHGKNGFLLQNEGSEYNLALIGLLFPVLVLGPGRLSVAWLLYPRSARTGRSIAALE